MIKHSFLFLFLYFLATVLVAQNRVSIELTVLDCKTNKTLPFANVYSLKTDEGTATNFEGNFKFQVLKGDTLTISFIGYENLLLPVNSATRLKKICLTPRLVELNPVEIQAKGDFLYDLLNRCRANRSTNLKEAKTYILLKSKVNNQQVELVEAYYNGKFRDYNLEKVDLKIGRTFLSPFNGDYFISLGTTSGMNLHKTFLKNLYFPLSPLEIPKGKLKKEFVLRFHEKFSQRNNTVYVLDFERREKNSRNFKGRLWVDSTQAELIKVKLKSEPGSVSPFIPVGNANNIDSVRFDITKNYKKVNGQRTLESINFNYELQYSRYNNSKVKVYTEAILFAYDYKDKFLLPFYQKEYSTNDYQSINLAPYNNFFWNYNREFKINEEEVEKRLFLEKETTNYVDSFSFNHSTKEISFNKTTYRKWSKSRLAVNNFKNDFSSVLVRGFFSISDRYFIDAKIHMDINQIEDSLNVQLTTIFDPFTSYVYMQNTPEVNAFINMYFDLIEMERQKLEENITGIKDPKKIIQLYKAQLREIQVIGKDYFSSTLAGRNPDEMEKWNDIIYQYLGINNLEIFEISK